MKLYRAGRLETAHEQSWSAAMLTIGSWLFVGLCVGIGFIPYALIPTLFILQAIFTVCISMFLVGLYFHLNRVLTASEKQKFLNIVWAFVFFALLFRFTGNGLLLFLPAIFNLIAVVIFKSLKRT